MSTLKVDTLQTTGGAGLYPAKAWVTYNMFGTASITADAGVSSLTDLGVGTPQFNLDTALPEANGSCWNTPAVYSGTIEYPVQSGARITSTTTFKGYCGSNGTARADWVEGYSGLIR